MVLVKAAALIPASVNPISVDRDNPMNISFLVLFCAKLFTEKLNIRMRINCIHQVVQSTAISAGEIEAGGVACHNANRENPSSKS